MIIICCHLRLLLYICLCITLVVFTKARLISEVCQKLAAGTVSIRAMVITAKKSDRELVVLTSDAYLLKMPANHFKRNEHELRLYLGNAKVYSLPTILKKLDDFGIYLEYANEKRFDNIFYFANDARGQSYLALFKYTKLTKDYKRLTHSAISVANSDGELELYQDAYLGAKQDRAYFDFVLSDSDPSSGYLFHTQFDANGNFSKGKRMCMIDDKTVPEVWIKGNLRVQKEKRQFCYDWSHEGTAPLSGFYLHDGDSKLLFYFWSGGRMAIFKDPSFVDSDVTDKADKSRTLKDILNCDYNEADNLDATNWTWLFWVIGALIVVGLIGAACYFIYIKNKYLIHEMKNKIKEKAKQIIKGSKAQSQVQSNIASEEMYSSSSSGVAASPNKSPAKKAKNKKSKKLL